MKQTFDLLEEVRAEVIKDTRGPETLMIAKVRHAMSKVLDNNFDNSEDKMNFLGNYAQSHDWFQTFNPNQPPIWDWVANRLKTKLVAQDVFDNHYNDKWEYKNSKERQRYN